MLLRLGRVPAVVASSAAAAEEAMKTRDLAFSGRPRMLMVERLLYSRDFAFAPYSKYWRQARRVCVLHVLSPRRIESFRLVRESEVAALVDRIRAHPTGGVVNLSDILVGYTNAVISRAAFSGGVCRLDGDDGGEKLRQVLANFMELLAATPVREIVSWLGWVDTLTGLEGKTRRTFEAIDGLLERVIADHRSRRRPGGWRVVDGEDNQRDFVDVLLDVDEMDKEAGFRLETDNIKALILDMFAAGTDTSYTVMTWAMAELINHPHQMWKLQDEIRTVVGIGGRITEDHLHKLPYLKGVITETLRLHPPFPLVPRETIEDTELLGYHIPARTRVMINVWAMGRDPAMWEHAEEFVPERFIDAPVDYSKVGQDFKFLPFGNGRRGCPGAGFAAPSMELALANILYHFDWELAHSGRRQGTPLLDMSEVHGLSVRLKASLLLVAKPWYGP
uniref:Cytochrome P450 71A1 n=1 Tax=Arundo donax TaxID=35708 RepID=A0A0A8Y7V4_ARUDO